MYPAIQTFFIEPTQFIHRSARCFDHESHKHPQCPAFSITKHTYHNAEVFVDRIEMSEDRTLPRDSDLPEDHPAWPTHCACGHAFVKEDRQTFIDTVYRRIDTGEEMTLRDAKPGAIWNAFWWPNPGTRDGLYLVARCPNGSDWMIDSRASNCTMPDDDTHKCWIRRGPPSCLTVEKAITIGSSASTTCGAGAGSIQVGDYHGFLTGGIFTAG
jgi:hypothetical protein